MKKILFAFLLMLVSVGAVGQKKVKTNDFHLLKVVYDKHADDMRLIGTNSLDFGGRKHVSFVGYVVPWYEVGLSYSESKLLADSCWYSIKIYIKDTTPQTLEKGRVLLLRLGNGQVIELYSEDDITRADNIYNNGHFGNFFYEHYTIIPSYKIDEVLLCDIIKHGVVKMRIETSSGYYDLPTNKMKGWRFPQILGALYELIKEKKETSNRVHDDF